MRTVRGGVAGSVAIVVALLSHLLGGGAVPGWQGVVTPWVLSLLVCVAVDGRRLSLWRLSFSVVASQVLFHTLFVLGAPPPTRPAPHGGPGVVPGPEVSSVVPAAAGTHAHTGLPEAATGAAPAGAGALAATASSGDVSMWLWHAVAAVVTIAALYRGERVLGRLRELATEAVRRVRSYRDVRPGAFAGAPRVPVPLPARADRRRRPDPQLSVRRRRGPPPVPAAPPVCGRLGS